MAAEQIAAWQVPGLAGSGPMASLPALQRSAVWKAGQIEAFWDSICRGFPVGTLLLAPFDPLRGNRGLNADRRRRAAKPLRPSTHHLLDGQQRSNALAVGFADIWSTLEDVPRGAALWMDLAAPAHARDGRNIVFRLVTQSHPWGYSRADPANRLEAAARRNALLRYQAHLPDAMLAGFQPGNVDLRYAWPWDAVLPVPVAFIAEAARAGVADEAGVAAHVLRRCAASLPFWADDAFDEVRAVLKNPTPAHLQKIAAVARVVAPPERAQYWFPVQIMGSVAAVVDPDADEPADGETPTDPVETLFVRVNAGGTRLDGEELNFSLLKSIWPDAEDLVHDLSSRIMSPSRLVMLLTRVILARQGHEKSPPARQNVRQFRRLVHGQNAARPRFLEELRHSLRSGHARRLLAQARALLACANGPQGAGLPPVLVADLARTGPEAFFLLLHWLDRCGFSREDAGEVPAATRRRLAGAMTTLAWFSRDDRLWLRSLWPTMQAKAGTALRKFWDADGVLLPAIAPVDGNYPLAFPIPPKVFAAGVAQRLRGLLRSENTATWANWSWDKDFVGPAPARDRIHVYMEKALRRALDRGEAVAGSDVSLLLWTDLAEKLWYMRQLVLYAQKDWLGKWFQNFDPSRLDQVEDTDRPWDMDHIHAENYVKGVRNPCAHFRLIQKEWHGCIGNLRAWPLELNRADGDASPAVKLSLDRAPELVARHSRFHIQSTADLRGASAIGTLDDWQRATPAAPFPVNYLRAPSACHPALLRAIVNRWIALYRGWYRDLDVGKLF
jgi:hypothetical protein